MSVQHGHEHHDHATHGGIAHTHLRQRSLSASLIALSALQRLLIVTPLLALLWLAVWWALGGEA